MQDLATTLIEGSGPAYAERPEAMALADEIAQRHGLDRRWVRRMIGKARQVPQVMRLVMPPPATCPRTGSSTAAASSTPRASGPAWPSGKSSRETLERASATYGVPAEVVVGILGVETYFGRHRAATACSMPWPRWPSIFPPNIRVPPSAAPSSALNWASS